MPKNLWYVSLRRKSHIKIIIIIVRTPSRSLRKLDLLNDSKSHPRICTTIDQRLYIWIGRQGRSYANVILFLWEVSLEELSEFRSILPNSPTMSFKSQTRPLTLPSTDADFDLLWKASIPSRIGLQASLPPFRVLNFQWKISLHLPNSSVSVKSASFWNCRRSQTASICSCSIFASQKNHAAPKILSVTRIIIRKTLKAVAHSMSLDVLLLVDHIILPQSFSTRIIRFSCRK